MKIIAKREAILSPLQAVIGVVERKQTMPILANVLAAQRRTLVSWLCKARINSGTESWPI